MENLFVLKKYDASSKESASYNESTYLRDVFKEIVRNKATLFALIWIVLILIFSFVFPLFSNSDTTSTNLGKTFLSPNSEHWFGTDELGRDLWARTWAGVNFSLSFSFITVLISATFGVIFGAISGFSNTTVDNFMQSVIELMENIPLLVFIGILFLTVSPTFTSLIIILSIFEWMGIARLTRGLVLQYREREFVLASMTLGRSKTSVLFRHILINIVGILAVNITILIPGIIFFETTLSYLGLGIKPPTPTIGVIMKDSSTAIVNNPTIILPIALIMGSLTIAFVFLANGVRDAFDPYARGEN